MVWRSHAIAKSAFIANTRRSVGWRSNTRTPPPLLLIATGSRSGMCSRPVVLATGRLHIPEREPVAISKSGGGVLVLLRQPTLRRVFAMNALFAMAWDLHTIFVPIYGARLHLSESQIGAVLSTFAAATFVVRLCMPGLMRWRSEHQVLTIALFVAGLVY